jgi:hypothetical protein
MSDPLSDTEDGYLDALDPAERSAMWRGLLHVTGAVAGTRTGRRPAMPDASPAHRRLR